MHILGSVKNLSEAQLLLRTPIDIIDLKDPDQGALGAVERDTLRAVVAHTNGARLISAAAGCASDTTVRACAAQWARDGVDFVKVGFSSATEQTLLTELGAAIVPHARAVAVLFVDMPDMKIDEWVAPVRTAGFNGLMLDTANKQSGPLPQHLSLEQAQRWVRRGRDAGLMCGLAGRLNAQTARTYLAANPDYMGFRSALCQLSLRCASLSPHAIRSLLDTLGQSDTQPAEVPSLMSVAADTYSAG